MRLPGEKDACSLVVGYRLKQHIHPQRASIMEARG
jgi:hypothetical protein